MRLTRCCDAPARQKRDIGLQYVHRSLTQAFVCLRLNWSAICLRKHERRIREVAINTPQPPTPAAINDVLPVPEEVINLRASLKALDRRDWGLWVTAIIILLLLCFTVFSLAIPSLRLEDKWLERDQIAIGIRGLLALVLLFCAFVIYQQHLIKDLRAKLHDQIAVVTALHARAETFERLSILDPLTGLFNRRFAYEHLPRELDRAERQGAPLVALMIDLDDFKSINDQHGHAAGDAALATFARHIKRAIRSSDLPIRMGGDEFLIVLPDCTPEQLQGPLQRIYGCGLEYDGQRIDIRFSVGVAKHEKGDSVATLLEKADATMYAMKQGGESPREWYDNWRERTAQE